MHINQESPVYKLIYMDVEQARAEARAEGLAERRAAGRVGALLVLRRFLAFRFQIPVTRYDRQLNSLGLAAIKQLGDIVLVASLAEFEQSLFQLSQSQDSDSGAT